MHFIAPTRFLLAGWLASGCAPGGGAGWPLTSETGPTGVEIVDGDFAWSELSPPEPDGGFFRIERGADGALWFVGRKAGRWDGADFTVWELDAAGVPAENFHFADTLAVLGPNDVWACGTALWHFDGDAWTERTALAGAAVTNPTPLESNRCEVATDGTTTFVYLNAQLYAVEGDALVLRPQPENPNNLSSIAVIDGEVYGTSNLGLDPVLWARDGNSFFSVGRDSFADGAFCVTESAWPALPECISANLAVEELPWIGGDLDASFADSILPTGLAHGDTADWVVSEGRLEAGEREDVDPPTEAVTALPFGFLVRTADGQAHALPDRFYNLETYRIAEVGGELFVTTSSGGVLHGEAR